MRNKIQRYIATIQQRACDLRDSAYNAALRAASFTLKMGVAASLVIAGIYAVSWLVSTAVLGTILLAKLAMLTYLFYKTNALINKQIEVADLKLAKASEENKNVNPGFLTRLGNYLGYAHANVVDVVQQAANGFMPSFDATGIALDSMISDDMPVAQPNKHQGIYQYR